MFVGAGGLKATRKPTEKLHKLLPDDAAAGAGRRGLLFDTWGGLLPAADYRRFLFGPDAHDSGSGCRNTVPTILCLHEERRERAASSIVESEGHRAWAWTGRFDSRARRGGYMRLGRLQGNRTPGVCSTDPATVERMP